MKFKMPFVLKCFLTKERITEMQDPIKQRVADGQCNSVVAGEVWEKSCSYKKFTQSIQDLCVVLAVGVTLLEPVSAYLLASEKCLADL